LTTDEIAVLASDAGREYTECMQYTIRDVPETVDRALRQRARADGKSLNKAALDALAEGAGVTGRRKRRDLRDIAGTWKTDKAVESALAAQDRIDEDLWR
jgi:plasmid stability protein